MLTELTHFERTVDRLNGLALLVPCAALAPLICSVMPRSYTEQHWSDRIWLAPTPSWEIALPHYGVGIGLVTTLTLLGLVFRAAVNRGDPSARKHAPLVSLAIIVSLYQGLCWMCWDTLPLATALFASVPVTIATVRSADTCKLDLFGQFCSTRRRIACSCTLSAAIGLLALRLEKPHHATAILLIALCLLVLGRRKLSASGQALRYRLESILAGDDAEFTTITLGGVTSVVARDSAYSMPYRSLSARGPEHAILEYDESFPN